MVLANEENEVWIAMELMNGGLDSFLRNDKYQIPFGTKIKTLIDAAKGMEHVAKKGFVHRDIACKNVMVSVQSSGWFSFFNSLSHIEIGTTITAF